MASSSATPLIDSPLGVKVQGRGFTCLFALACLWLIVGGYCDSWAHLHIPRLETFFTPWHGLLYAGLLAVTLVVGGAMGINRRRGYRGLEAIPAGYELAAYGVLLFFVAGVADMCWHTLFGFEKNIDGQFSPPHLVIMVAYGLIACGWYRALWQAPTPRRLWFTLPLATTLVMGFANLLLMPIHPYNFFYSATISAAQYDQQLLAATSFFLSSVALSVVVLLTVRRWSPAPGCFTVVYGVTGSAMALMQAHWLMLAVAWLSGLLVDTLVWWLRPSLQRPVALRLFAALHPCFYYLVYYCTLTLGYGTTWTVHMLGGAILIPGIIGWLLSLLLFPPSGFPVVQEPPSTKEGAS